MNATTDNLMEQLRALDPVGNANLDQPLWDPTASELLESILASEPQAPAQPTPPQSQRARRRRIRKRVLVPFAVAAVAALALVIGLPGGGGNRDRATVALTNVANAAAAQTPPVTDLPYLYLKTESTFVNTTVLKEGSWSVYHSETREEWAAKDGSGRLHAVDAPPRFVGPGDRAAWEAAGSPNFLPSGFTGHSEERTVPAGTFTNGVSDLPTDPNALAKVLREEAEGSQGSVPVTARTLDLIAEDLRNPAASPELRKALYEAATQIPGIEYLGKATDSAGRRGVAVGVTSSYSGGPTLYSLIYDPNTSEVLATEEKALEKVGFADSETPMLLGATVYLDSGAVESSSSTP